MSNLTALFCTVCVINFIVLCVCDQQIWHSYQFGTGHINREELTIDSVKYDKNFNPVPNVTSWKTIATKEKTYAVGLTNTGVTILNFHLDGKNYTIGREAFDFNISIVDFAFFDYKPHPILILGSYFNNQSFELTWYKLNDKLELFWAWQVIKNITHVSYFKLADDRTMLALITKAHNLPTLDLYEFSLTTGEENFWLVQSISLAEAPAELAINTFGPDTFLSIPQTNLGIVMVFKYSGSHFEQFQNISSFGISRVTSFNVGFKSFLAIGAEQSSIYQFTSHRLLEEIITSSLAKINFWLPVPIKTFQQDVVLLAQKVLKHDTHTSYFLEVFIYNGKTFVMHEEIPCSYFEEKEYGVNCMIDEEEQTGLSGSAVVPLGQTVGVLVPQKLHSMLFLLATSTKKLKSSVEKLAETKERLQKLVDERQRTSEEIFVAPWDPQIPSGAFIQDPRSLIQNLRQEVENIRFEIDKARSQLKNTVLLNETHHFDQLTVHGNIEVLGKIEFKSVVTQTLNEEVPSKVINDLVRKDSDKLITAPTTFNNLQTKNLTFGAINSVPANNLPIISNFFRGNLTFNKPVHVKRNVVVNSGEINGQFLPNQIVLMDSPYNGSLSFKKVRVEDLQVNSLNDQILLRFDDIRGDFSSRDEVLEIDELVVDGNITTEDVNGEIFTDFLSSICLTNSKTYIPGNVTIEGDLIVDDELTAQFFNNLKFPEEYMVSNRQHTDVTGHKNFTGVTEADAVLIDETINGLAIDTIITTNFDQKISGNFTFDDIEILRLDVNGTQENLVTDELKNNPTLLESNEINAKVQFQNLEIEGNVVLSGNYQQSTLKDILSDVVYTDENDAVINSIKTLSFGLTVNKGINVHSKSINEFPLDEFVTKNSEQTLAFKTLNGSVSFEHLYMEGTFDGINITDSYEEMIKLNGSQFVSSTITFANNDDNVIDLTATDLVISNTLNNLTAEEYFFTTVADNVYVKGNTTGAITDFSLEEFDKNRLSLSKPVVTATYEVKDLICDDFQADYLNGARFQNMFDYDAYTDIIVQNLLTGQLGVQHLIVNGSVTSEQLNGENVRELSKSYIWTNKTNNLKTAIFTNVIFETLNLEHLNGMKFDHLIEDVVFKTETNPIINSLKHYINGIHVEKFLNSERINDIHVDHVLRKSGRQSVSGPLVIEGNVIVATDCDVQETLNGVPIDYLKRTYEFVDDNETLIINGDLFMPRLQYIDSLVVQDRANGHKFKRFLQNVVFKSKKANFDKNVEFRNTVQIKQNLVVENLINGVDFSEFVEDMVFTTKDDIIEGGVIFTSPITINEKLFVSSDLLAKQISGIDFSKWENDAVVINKGQIPGQLIFESVTVQDYLTVNFTNELDMSKLIPLKTDQYINGSLSFVELTPFHNISVGNFVNGMNLSEEFKNSLLMVQTPQEVSSKVIFNGPVFVRDSLRMMGSLNNRRISDVVTTNTNQNLSALYEFTGNVTLANLELGGLAQNINVTQWKNEALTTSSNDLQTVDSPWNVLGNLTFTQNVGSSGFLGGIDLEQLKHQMEERNTKMRLGENKAMTDYAKVCRDVNTVIKRAQRQPYLFKYFEHMHKADLSFDWDIQHVFPFQHKNGNYLLVSFRNICTASLYFWENDRYEFIEIVKMGTIVQLIPIYDGEDLFFVSRNDKSNLKCEVQLTNLWKFEKDASEIRLAEGFNISHVELVYELEPTRLLQESLIPRTFYALGDASVTEFKITSGIANDVKAYRKWHINGDNLVFIPRGLGTGLALSDGLRVFTLLRDSANNDYLGYNYDETIVGQLVMETDLFLAGRFKNDSIVLSVGLGVTRRSLLVSTFQEDVAVRGRFDLINIYDDKKLFQKIPTSKPISLMSLEFGNKGQTLLLFLEDNTFLQVYEYKGIEGFVRRVQINMEGSSLFKLSLPLYKEKNPNQVIGVVHKNEVRLLRAVMSGNEIDIEEQNCDLL